MAATELTTPTTAPWYVPLTRAVPAAALAIVITFAGGNYSPDFGLACLGGFALVSGVAGIVVSLRAFARGVYRTIFLVQAIVSVVTGILALAGQQVGLPLFLVLLSGWAAITGFLELYAGLRSRRERLATSRDWMFVGALTAVLAIVSLVIPPDYVQHYQAPDHTDRILNTSVVVVGLLSVYGAITAVYLIIAALSLKWGPSATPRDGTAS
ncbi:hypothetical protein [Galbitalea soli]|uniref:DUF308 domain-containing protein n=1 Tax=Galbitalea soli TaxID=1268042 RepID=A0A7C9TRY3_9MICO|nr:hypothetical protein [Galbitalea soli]NEM91780.1 hypothetical protein [Galbitalea soli]NYJ29387.1 uncharacterized membrane protein HdeD (DUF308 family) [Galbitalea soli]